MTSPDPEVTQITEAIKVALSEEMSKRGLYLVQSCSIVKVMNDQGCQQVFMFSTPETITAWDVRGMLSYVMSIENAREIVLYIQGEKE